MRLFKLQRKVDCSGVSGTGVVAEGVEFDDGQVVLRWLTAHASTGVYKNWEDVEWVHGHQGATEIVWLVAADVNTCQAMAL